MSRSKREGSLASPSPSPPPHLPYFFSKTGLLISKQFSKSKPSKGKVGERMPVPLPTPIPTICLIPLAHEINPTSGLLDPPRRLEKKILWEPHLLRLIEEFADTKSLARKQHLRSSYKKKKQRQVEQKGCNGINDIPIAAYTDDGSFLFNHGFTMQMDAPGLGNSEVEAYEYDSALQQTHVHYFPNCATVAKRQGKYWVWRWRGRGKGPRVEIFTLDQLQDPQNMDPEYKEPIPESTIFLPRLITAVSTLECGDSKGNWILQLGGSDENHGETTNKLLVWNEQTKESYEITMDQTDEVGTMFDYYTYDCFGVYKDKLYIRTRRCHGGYGIDEHQIICDDRPELGPFSPSKVVATTFLRTFQTNWGYGMLRGTPGWFHVDPCSGMLMIQTTVAYHGKPRLEIVLVDPEKVPVPWSFPSMNPFITMPKVACHVIPTKVSKQHAFVGFHPKPQWGYGIVVFIGHKLYFF